MARKAAIEASRTTSRFAASEGGIVWAETSMTMPVSKSRSTARESPGRCGRTTSIASSTLPRSSSATAAFRSLSAEPGACTSAAMPGCGAKRCSALRSAVPERQNRAAAASTAARAGTGLRIGGLLGLCGFAAVFLTSNDGFENQPEGTASPILPRPPCRTLCRNQTPRRGRPAGGIENQTVKRPSGPVRSPIACWRRTHRPSCRRWRPCRRSSRTFRSRPEERHCLHS